MESRKKRFHPDLEAEGPFTSAVAFSHDSQLIAFADESAVRFVDTATGLEVGDRCRHVLAVTGIAFRPPDSTQFATSSEGDGVLLWDTRTRQVLRKFEAHKLACSVAFSPDGQLLTAAGGDGLVRVWDVNDPGGAPRLLKGHAGRVWCVAFSPDGKYVASGGDDFAVRVWDAATGEELHTLWGHKGIVFSVAFDADGYLGSAGDIDMLRGEGGGQVFIWKLPP